MNSVSIMKKFLSAVMIAGSVLGMSVFSTVAVAQGGTMLSFGDIAKAIDNCEKLLTQAAELDAAGGDKALIIKLLRAARQSSKEITGDNFGAELDFTQDKLKRAYVGVKKDRENRAESLAEAIKGFQILKKLI